MPHLRPPGLFITATDTEVGKTVATCAIASVLRRQGLRVGVCKPIASGCRVAREGLVNGDAEALAHFADCRLPLSVICPVRYRAPLAPGVAAEQTDRSVDEQAVHDALDRLSQDHDVLLVEGVGGLLVPLSPKRTVAHLAADIGYPVVIVTRPNLGTLNHTALTCAAARQAGLRIAGLVINQYDPESIDPSVADNPRWLAKQNKTSVLATLPRAEGVDVEKGRLPEPIVAAAGMVDWREVAKPAKARRDRG